MSYDLASVSGQIAALADGAETPVTLAEQALERESANRDLNAFVALDPDIVLAQAEAAARRRKTGSAASPIDGVPIAVKDNYLTRDYPTTACSNALPADAGGIDATVVARLRAAGAVIFGKTNMHEWAYGATNSVSSFGPTRNPHDRDRITGGSSGGSAAAVASGIVGAALGSDTGGSIRIPAAACGIYGFKPGYGRASRNGVLALSWSLDAPGPLAARLDDIGHLLPFFLGRDRADPSTFAASPMRSADPVISPKLVSLTGSGLERSDDVEAAMQAALKQAGLAVPPVELTQVASYFAAWETILHCEATAYHRQRMAQDPAGFSAVTCAHLMAGSQLTAQELLEAQAIRTHFTELLLQSLGEWDALVLPTLPVVAPIAGEDWQAFGGRKVTTQDSMTWFCWIGNLAGLPAVTVPVPNPVSGLPVGMMLMGRPGRDEELLAIAGLMDRRINGKDRM
ncbi:amidase [Martelella mediterranea]|uniref:amidase n=1 Tax=Martelella mediterranea TaxID=293089 RepID=UPI001E36AA80|nr:amidase [Martelella mediterranea]MCD1635026.1 amidase [Martelella mediterranea]